MSDGRDPAGGGGARAGTVTQELPEAALARVVREHAGRPAASLVHLLGDFAAAEDLVQDAVVIAL